MHIQFLNPGTVAVTSASDTFNRADQPPFLGSQFDMQISTATNLAGATMDGLVNVGGGVATFGLVGSGGLFNSNFVPAYVDRQAVKQATVAGGRTEFSQLRMRSVNGGVTCAMGPMVLNPNPNDSNCYILIANNARVLQLFRDVGAAAAIINAAVGAWADNDVILIEVDPGTASNTVRCFKNGVLQSTDVDANAARPQGGGMFGISFFSSNAAGGSLSFDNWSGGLR